MSHDRREDFEDGEPPMSTMRQVHEHYAEHMNTLAQSGDGQTGQKVPIRAGHREYRYPQALTAEERLAAERTWASLPRWEDLIAHA